MQPPHDPATKSSGQESRGTLNKYRTGYKAEHGHDNHLKQFQNDNTMIQQFGKMAYCKSEIYCLSKITIQFLQNSSGRCL
jgi:hypothetical protein